MLEDLTEEQIKAYRLVDNKLNESDWDFSLLDEELGVLSEDIDMSIFGFDFSDEIEEEEHKKKVEFEVKKENKIIRTNRRMRNMVINDLMELIKKLFGNNYEDVIVVDVDGNEHNADDMTVKELKSYDINKIDEIKAYEDKIYIYF